MAPEEFFKTIPDTLDEMSNMILFDSDIIFANNSFNYSGESLINFWRREIRKVVATSKQLAALVLFYDVLLKQQLYKGTVSNYNAIYSPTNTMYYEKYYVLEYHYHIFTQGWNSSRFYFFMSIYIRSTRSSISSWENVLASSSNNQYTLSSINYYTYFKNDNPVQTYHVIYILFLNTRSCRWPFVHIGRETELCQTQENMSIKTDSGHWSTVLWQGAPNPQFSGYVRIKDSYL